MRVDEWLKGLVLAPKFQGGVVRAWRHAKCYREVTREQLVELEVLPTP
jgi:hypothetical protein